MTNPEQHASIQSLLKRRALLVLIIVSLACLLIWIGVSMYFSFRKTTLSPNVQKQLQPLTPVLDGNALKELEKRRPYSPEELVEFNVVKEIVADEGGTGSQKKSAAAPKPSASPSSTSSAQSKVASESGQATQ